MPLKSLLLALTLSLVACSGGDEEAAQAPDEPAAQEAPATTSGTALRASQRLLGTWAIEMTAADKRRHTILSMAIQEPAPRPEEVEALELTPEEQTQFQLTTMMVEQNGDNPDIEEFKSLIRNMDKAVMTISADQMVMDIGGIKDVATYVVVSENQEGVAVKSRREGEPEESLDITFEGGDRIRMVDITTPEDVMVFVRRK